MRTLQWKTSVVADVAGVESERPQSSAHAHGHALLADLLPDIVGQVRPGYLVEIGTTREKLPGQGSTVLLAELAARLQLPFITVDMDPANTEQARVDLAALPNARAVTARGEDYLRSFREPIVAAYLDAFDIQHGKHSEYRIERYRRYLGVEITNERASAMHLECARALVKRLVPGGLVVIDDTSPDGEGYVGKGKAAVPALLDRGFRIVAQAPTAIALRAPETSLESLPVRLLRRAAGRVFARGPVSGR